MKKSLIILFGIILITSKNCFSQWIQTDGPYGNTNVTAIFESNSEIFVGTSCGLHINDSITTRWKYHANIDIGVYDQKGDSIFYGGYNSGINLLILSIENIEPISKGLASTVNTIKGSDTCLYVGVETGGFAKSIGFTDNWIYYNEGLPTDTMYIPPKFGGGEYYVRYVNSIVTFGDKIFCGTNKGVFKSNIHNISWSESNTGLPKEPVNIIEVFNDTLFACIENAVYLSSNSGNTWSELYTTPSKINSVQKLNGIFYITTSDNGIYKSENLSTWTDLNSGLTDLNINIIELIDSILVCGSLTEGFHYLFGNTWTTNSSGIICSSIRSMTIANESLIANDDKNIYKLNNNNWKNISPNVKNDLFIKLDNMGDTIFICNYYMQSGWPYIFQSIYYTTDFGNSWNEISTLPYTSAGGDSWHMIYIDKNRIYAYSSDKMFFTDNLGVNWNDISLPSQYCNNFNAFITFNSIPFASACGIAQLITLDNQNNWTLSNNGLPNDREIENLAKTNDALYAYVQVHGIYVSKDNGQSWIKATNGLETDWGNRSFAYRDKNIFITTQKGVYYSDDYGQNWYILNDGLINNNVSSIAVLNDTLFVGTYGNGIWKHDIESIPLSTPEFTINNELTIYPNPASDYLNIQLPANFKGEIQILDLMGRKIILKKIDTFENFDITNIPNGTYLIIYKSKENIKMNKLIISR